MQQRRRCTLSLPAIEKSAELEKSLTNSQIRGSNCHLLPLGTQWTKVLKSSMLVRNSWRFSSTVNLEWSRPSSKKRQTEAWKLFYWGPFSVSELLFSISGCNRSSINLNKRLILFSTDLTIGILVCTTMLNEHDKEKTPIISLLTN